MNLPLSDGASRFPAALGRALGGGAAPPGEAVQASALVALRGHLWLSPELALREGVAVSPGSRLRYRTTIDQWLRVFLARRAWTPSVRVAFSHVHQEGHQDFTEHPLGSAFGVAESIEHRTGLALGLGLDVPRPVGHRGRRSRVRGFVPSRCAGDLGTGLRRAPGQRRVQRGNLARAGAAASICWSGAALTVAAGLGPACLRPSTSPSPSTSTSTPV